MKDKKKLNWKKIGLSILYPHKAVLICLFPISVLILILSLMYLKPTSILAIFSYLIAFYLLVVVSFRMPKIINYFKQFKKQNKLMRKWSTDVNLRIKVSTNPKNLFFLSYST